MDISGAFCENISSQNLFHKKDRLLLAVSGGLDSVVLAELCRRAGFDFAIAHCNFQLRGEESLRDRYFVQSLAAKWGVPFFVKDFDTERYSVEKKLSIQEAARELRYQWFNELLQPGNNDFQPKHILTAHHADDNVETIVMNFFRGTGIAGIRGMLPKQGKIIRPLLFAERKDILAFANHEKLEWVEDSSNQSDKYSRNYFRHLVLPSIENIYPGAFANLSSNAERFREIEELYRKAIEDQKKKLLEFNGNEVHIPVLKLKKASPLKTVVYEIIRDYGFTSSQVPDVISLLDADTGKYLASGTHRIIRNRKWLIIAGVESDAASVHVINACGEKIQVNDFSLACNTRENKNQQPDPSADIAVLDAATVTFPLIIRKWKTGDYFYPLGMTKKKKLSRFFIDQKLSKTGKENIYIIESDKRIVWVTGMRIDNRFRVTEKTKELLEIKKTRL